MPANVPADLRRRRHELVLQVQRAGSVAGVFAEASTRLRRMVPFTAAAWMMTDPATGLLTAPTRLERERGEHPDDEAAACAKILRWEFLGGDVNLFRDLAGAEVPAAALWASVGDPERSVHYRELLRPLGYADELRAVLRVGDSPWGVIALNRNAGQPPFTPREVSLVASLSAPLGEALRLRARPAGTPGGPDGGDHPGLLLFDAEGVLVAADDQARAWLAELPAREATYPSDLGVRLPLWLMSAVFRAGAAAGGHGDGTARARFRSGGRWLVCHASCLWDAGGALERVAVAIEPATATEIAPIIVAAYGLSDREQQITRLVARGASTTDMAAELYLSPHTVRDYVKAVLRKVGVSSRGELVAKLFAEYYQPIHHTGDMTRVYG